MDSERPISSAKAQYMPWSVVLLNLLAPKLIANTIASGESATSHISGPVAKV